MDWRLRVTEREVSRMDRCKSTMAQYRIKIEEKKKKRMVGWMVLPFADMRSTGPSLRWGNHEFMLGQVGSGASRDAHYGYQVGSTEAEGKYSHVTFPTDMRWSNTSCSHKRPSAVLTYTPEVGVVLAEPRRRWP